MGWFTLGSKWEDYFISNLNSVKELSKDNETKVGALIIDTKEKVVVSSGFNGLPRKVRDDPDRLTRPIKYQYMIHAEVNAVLRAMNDGRSVKGLTLLSTLGVCCNCASILTQVGIKEVVCPPLDYNHISCGDGYRATEKMFREAGVVLIESLSLVRNGL